MNDFGTSARGPMRELDLDDRFWRDALEALRSRHGAQALETRYAPYAKTIEEIGRQAREDATLVGLRFEGEGRNARLLAFLSTALLARAGLRAVFVDLSQDLRWLERLTGLDLKQGLVDHVHYGVPLERCVRDTALPGLAVLTGGTRFLTGSPLEDAPAVRGALDRLKQHFRVVVMALPSSEPVSEAGVIALCDALIAVTAEDEEPALIGRERMVVRLVGDPQAAHDLASAAHRFVGPIPSLLAGSMGTEPPPVAAMTATVTDPFRSRAVFSTPPEADEDVAFLSLFEGGGPEAEEAPHDLAGFEEIEFPDEERLADGREWPARRRRRMMASAGVAAVVLGGMVLGARLLPNLDFPATVEEPRGSGGESLDIDRRPIGFEDESDRDPGAVVSLGKDSVGQTSTAGALSEDVVETSGRPVPYSLHVGSFQSQASALEAVGRLEREGWSAFVAPVALDERGMWHRVYAGSFADSAAAGLALRSLLARGLVADGAVRATPLTFLLGTYPSREEAERRRAELRERGIPAYVAGSGPARVYAGAYATAEESRLLEGSLHAAAENARLTTRVES